MLNRQMGRMEDAEHQNFSQVAYSGGHVSTLLKVFLLVPMSTPSLSIKQFIKTSPVHQPSLYPQERAGKRTEPNPQAERMARTQTVSRIYTMSRRHQGFLSSRYICACRCGGPVGAGTLFLGSQCRVQMAGSTSEFSLPFSQNRRLRSPPPPPPARTFQILLGRFPTGQT